MKIVKLVLSILAGLVFVISAFVKLFPVELFEVAAVETGLVGWMLAPFAARAVIGFEFFIGIMLILGFYRHFFVKISLYTLGIFTAYLLYLFFTEGNSSNCNCFGLAYAMTPLQSMIKNLILILMLAFVLWKSNPVQRKRYKLYLSIIAGIVSMGLPYVFAPIIIGVAGYDVDRINYPLDLAAIYEDPDAVKPETNLGEGKHIILFLSSSCQHCIVAAYKFSVMKSRYPELPVFLFINGDDNDIKEFHFKSKTGDLPYAHIKAGTLIYLAGNRLPAILWLDNGMVVKKQNYFEISEDEILQWLEIN
jgi:hypothetical protein